MAVTRTKFPAAAMKVAATQAIPGATTAPGTRTRPNPLDKTLKPATSTGGAAVSNPKSRTMTPRTFPPDAGTRATNVGGRRGR